MREKLRSTIQQNDAVVQGAGCLLIAVDTQYRVTFFEGAHRDGVLAEAQVVGRVEGQDYRVLSPAPELIDGVEKVIQGEASSLQLEWMQRQRSYRCLLTPLTDHRDGTTRINGCIIVAHDITDLVSTQARLQQSYEERARLQVAETAATEASRLKSEFLALTSHELRTPIAHMLGLSELLLAEDLTESQKNLASQILRSGDVLLEMIGQVLVSRLRRAGLPSGADSASPQDMGKVEAGKLDLEVRPFSLNDLSSDARLFATAASKKGIAFIEDVDDFRAPVQGDMPRLRQVLTNLLSNAIKFTKTGSVTLRVKRVKEDAESVSVRWQVQDTGIGVKKEAIGSLFKPFQFVTLCRSIAHTVLTPTYSQPSRRFDFSSIRRHWSRSLHLEERESRTHALATFVADMSSAAHRAHGWLDPPRVRVRRRYDHDCRAQAAQGAWAARRASRFHARQRGGHPTR